MLTLFNTDGRKIETFRPVNDTVVNVFTCGPSVYQRAHIGNFRTYLFEDVLVRYLEYLGYTVRRGMNFTDVEDKALDEARARGMTVKEMTDHNIEEFIDEMHLLRIKVPDYMARASEAIDGAVEIIETLLDRGIAYWYGGNVYFDPLKFPDLGKLFGLDMSRWPAKKRRFHKDTYPGMRWNRGDFIIWDGCAAPEDACWRTKIGSGRPAWNIQDASIIRKHIDETLSIYCGGIDNLIRHHDYSIAILESIRPYPMARYWLHCHHLFIDGRKMSKSRGNMHYTDTLQNMGFNPAEIRFFLIYGHYRRRINFTDTAMRKTAEKLRSFTGKMSAIHVMAQSATGSAGTPRGEQLLNAFTAHMDDDLDIRCAFDSVERLVSEIDVSRISPGEACDVVAALGRIDGVLQVLDCA